MTCPKVSSTAATERNVMLLYWVPLRSVEYSSSEHFEEVNHRWNILPVHSEQLNLTNLRSSYWCCKLHVPLYRLERRKPRLDAGQEPRNQRVENDWLDRSQYRLIRDATGEKHFKSLYSCRHKSLWGSSFSFYQTFILLCSTLFKHHATSMYSYTDISSTISYCH